MINGNLYLQKLNSDGTWSQANLSDPSSPISNVRDTDGIADAQADYDLEKDKLEEQDSILDIQMKNLETERSALDTELESVQAIIKKNIENSFKSFA
ncbi:hypothetical protein SDC9_211713 [bioreactor metagenome]|uniref:Uncharacterized protein n=1 Tax=bioreactor metagenome TaxID=1076179 RepID=A0A645JW98_9ZZZZ